AVRCEVEEIFVTIVQEPPGANWLEMAARNLLATLVRQGDRFDPVNGVLQDEEFAEAQDQFVRQHRIGRRGAEIEKERSVRPKQAANLAGPTFTPIQI